MWVLQALALMLSIQAGTLDLVETPPVVGNIPAFLPAPVSLPGANPALSVLKGSATDQRLPPKKPGPPSKGGKCVPAARYFVSGGKIQEYLMNTLPPQIENLVRCDGVDLEGLIADVLATLQNSDVLSILDAASLLQGAGGLGLGGVLGKEGNEDSSKSSSGSKLPGGLGQLIPGGLTDSLPGKEMLSGLLGGDKGSGKGLLNGNGLANIKNPVDGIVENASNLTDALQDQVNNVIPEGINEPVSDLLHTNLKDTLLKLEITEVTVDSTDLTMNADEIQVLSMVTAIIEGKGLLGTVATALQFQSNMAVTMKIAVSSNNTQCVNLDVQDTHIEVNEMHIQLVETVTETVPLPLPLNDLVPVLLTAKVNENLKKSNSCDIVLNDFNDCKNTTGLFSYQVHNAKIDPKGLSIFYCATANIGNKTVPVPGSRLPPIPKNASIAVTVSSTTLKTIVKHVAQQSSVQMNDLEAKITSIAFASQENNVLRVKYKVDITKNGESFATGETTLLISHGSKIANSKLVPDIKLTRSDHSVVPPEAKEEVEGIMSEVTKKAWANFNELYKKMNIPDGVSSNTLMNSDVKLLKKNDLQATN